MLPRSNGGLFVVVVCLMLCQIVALIWAIVANSKNKHRKWKVEKSDVYVFLTALGVLVLWRITDDVNLAALLNFARSWLGEVPQMRKNFIAPHTDKISIYMITMIRNTLAIATLTSWNFVGIIGTFGYILQSGVEICWLLYARARISRKNVSRKLELAPESIDNLDESAADGPQNSDDSL